MAKRIEYEVGSDCRETVFRNEKDAIEALWLMGFYHGFEVNKNRVKSALDKEGHYEKFPLSIMKRTAMPMDKS